MCLGEISILECFRLKVFEWSINVNITAGVDEKLLLISVGKIV